MDNLPSTSAIVHVTSEDFNDLIEVWEASVRATHLFLPEEYILFLKPLILNEYFKMVNLAGIRDENSKVSGFIGVAEDKIEMLFIHPSIRGKGIGKKLLMYAINELYTTKVDVNEQNEQAVGFYEHIGFKVIGRSAVDGLGKPYPILQMELLNP